jgi:hypothetical protein
LPAAGTDERRLSPTQADLDAERWGSTVTVVGEEHYQETVLTALPDGWDHHWCPCRGFRLIVGGGSIPRPVPRLVDLLLRDGDEALGQGLEAVERLSFLRRPRAARLAFRHAASLLRRVRASPPYSSLFSACPPAMTRPCAAR